MVLVSDTTRPKAARSHTFLYYEVEAIKRLNLPVVFANLNGSRNIQSAKLPASLVERYTINVAFGPTIIKYALDEYIAAYAANLSSNQKTGTYYYKDAVYSKLGL